MSRVFLQGKRNKILGKNVALNVGLQLLGVVVSFGLLPLTLRVTSVEQVGFWLTINSVLSWLAYSDFGLGTGLKNRLGEAIARSDIDKGKYYVSSAYFFVLILSLVFGVITVLSFLYCGDLIVAFLFGKASVSSQLRLVLLTVLILFYVRFPLQLLYPILDANQKLYMVKFLRVVGQLMVLIILAVLAYVGGKLSLLDLAYLHSSVPIIILLLSSFIYFSLNQSQRPSFKFFDGSNFKDLFGLGGRYFLIQINMLVLFQSANFLIARLSGPKDVVVFSTVFTLFSSLNIGFSAIVAPYWSAFLNAINQNDIEWVSRALIRLKWIWLFVMIVGALIAYNADWIVFIWIGDSVELPKYLAWLVYAFMALFTYGMTSNMVINSTGKIYVQTLVMSVISMVYLPLVYLLFNYTSLGILSIPIGMSLIGVYTVFFAPYHARTILENRTKGLFAK